MNIYTWIALALMAGCGFSYLGATVRAWIGFTLAGTIITLWFLEVYG
jgi:putative effector of murein hydrolase LrgA (UPF0299 family)